MKQLKTPAKEAIIKLSIDSSVVSAHTAYVAVDEDQASPLREPWMSPPAGDGYFLWNACKP